LPFGYINFNHKAIRGKTSQEKDEQVVSASHFQKLELRHAIGLFYRLFAMIWFISYEELAKFILKWDFTFFHLLLLMAYLQIVVFLSLEE
jgi:hypothetical protein